MSESARDLPIGTRVQATIDGSQVFWEKVSEDRWERRGWCRSGFIDGLISDGLVSEIIEPPK